MQADDNFGFKPASSTRRKDQATNCYIMVKGIITVSQCLQREKTLREEGIDFDI